MPNELVTQESTPMLHDMKPNAMVAHASIMARELASVIDKQKLYTVIGGKKHVRIEGWSTLGTMLGIVPRECRVVELPDGSYEAEVELFSMRSDQVVGRASAICGIDERRWSTADRYARRSMAITRATGKAFRLGFGWILTLAGYEATPAEEMPQQISENAAPTTDRKPSIYDGSDDHQEKIKDILIKRKVPEEKWAEVHEKLLGKPSTELNNVIKEIMK